MYNVHVHVYAHMYSTAHMELMSLIACKSRALDLQGKDSSTRGREGSSSHGRVLSSVCAIQYIHVHVPLLSVQKDRESRIDCLSLSEASEW